MVYLKSHSRHFVMSAENYKGLCDARLQRFTTSSSSYKTINFKLLRLVL